MRSLDIIENAKGKDSIDAALILQNIGMVYFFQNNYKAALEHELRSLQIKQKVKGKDSIDATSSLNEIGNIYSKQGKYNIALKYY